MAQFVIEPAITVKWFVPEVHSSPAARLLDGGHELLASDALFTEAARLINTKTRLGELTYNEAVQILEAIQSVPISLKPSQTLLTSALHIAAVLDLPLGDGLGLAVAIHSDCRLVTASQTLYDKLQNTPFAVHVKWVGDLR